MCLVRCTQHYKHHVIWLRIGGDIAQSLLKPHLLHQLLLSKYLLEVWQLFSQQNESRENNVFQRFFRVTWPDDVMLTKPFPRWSEHHKNHVIWPRTGQDTAYSLLKPLLLPGLLLGLRLSLVSNWLQQRLECISASSYPIDMILPAFWWDNWGPSTRIVIRSCDLPNAVLWLLLLVSHHCWAD